MLAIISARPGLFLVSEKIRLEVWQMLMLSLVTLWRNTRLHFAPAVPTREFQSCFDRWIRLSSPRDFSTRRAMRKIILSKLDIRLELSADELEGFPPCMLGGVRGMMSSSSSSSSSETRSTFCRDQCARQKKI